MPENITVVGAALYSRNYLIWVPTRLKINVIRTMPIREFRPPDNLCEKRSVFDALLSAFIGRSVSN
jgi:hypothetical protein